MHADKQICGRNPDSQYVDLAVDVFSMLADATRVRIILALSDHGELSVNHLANVVGKAPAAVSQHLAKLRLARMVAARQDGTRAFYSLADEHASRLVTEAIFQAEHSLGGVPRHHHAMADPMADPTVGEAGEDGQAGETRKAAASEAGKPAMEVRA